MARRKKMAAVEKHKVLMEMEKSMGNLGEILDFYRFLVDGKAWESWMFLADGDPIIC
jgi:hypothetical protein